MTPQSEIDLLLGCLRLEDTPQKSARLAAYTPADWQAVLHQARLHGVLPLLDWQVQRLDPPPPAVPPPVRQEMHQARLQNAARNMFLYNELGQVLQILQQEAIPVIVLKGLHLAELVYADMALRRISDLDLLLPVSDLDRASRALICKGYRPHRHFTTEREISIHHHLPPLITSSGDWLELHWNLLPPERPVQIDVDDLWKVAQPAVIAGYPVFVLPPEYLLLHLCLHFYEHDFRLGLRHLYDLALILERTSYQLDWDILTTYAAQPVVKKVIFLAFHLVQKLLNAPLPGEILTQLQPPDFTLQIAVLAQERILKEPSVVPVHPDMAAIWGGASLWSRLKVFFSILFPPRYHVADKFGLPRDAARVYLYYPLRWGRLFRQYGRQALGLLKGNSTLRASAYQENILRAWWNENNADHT